MTISMRTLFGWVAFAALGTAALTQATVFWTSAVFSGAVLFCVWAMLSATLLRDTRRLFWIGAAVCGLSYFFVVGGGLAAFSGQSGVGGRLLLTHQLLAWIAPRNGAPSYFLTEDELWSRSIFNEFSAAISLPPKAMPAPPPTSVPTLDSGVPSFDSVTEGDSAPQPQYTPSAPPIGFGATPPPLTVNDVGRTNRFLIIGHCLFVILSGCCGGVCAKRFLAELPRSESST